MTNITRVHANFFGKVQGVSFRYFTEGLANALLLNGTVENKERDQLEVFIEGDVETVERFLKAMTYGPRFSRVDSFTFEEIPITGEIGGFSPIYPVKPVAIYNWYQPNGLSSLKTCEFCDASWFTTVKDVDGVPYDVCREHYYLWFAVT
jgi:acylphosphatase